MEKIVWIEEAEARGKDRRERFQSSFYKKDPVFLRGPSAFTLAAACLNFGCAWPCLDGV
jgi:hypothetical protein